ncbi:hypothetical protein Barb7_00482 [Bacteroidales bacterium Barb7]|nr:hypothetical protein Barb7_00482 [Bacteroidales bacterium Barb7]
MEKDISYEITVMPQVLSSMDITDAVVSMDAMVPKQRLLPR